MFGNKSLNLTGTKMVKYLYTLNLINNKTVFFENRDVLFEYHWVVVPFCCAVRAVRSLSTL